MPLKRISIFSLTAVLAIVAIHSQGAEGDDHKVRVRLTAKQRDITFVITETVLLTTAESEHSLAPGTYSVKLSEAHPAKQRFHLFIKTFSPSEAGEARAYVAQWKQQGYDPEIVTFGKEFRSESGNVVDGRGLWVSVARLDSMEKASSLKTKLERQQVWGWIVQETVERAKETLVFNGSSEKGVTKLQAPVRMLCKRPIEIRNVDFGFWRSQRANRSYAGTLEIAVGPDGLLEIYETLPLEDYVAGVLPAEMPASWPIEAIKAQAVAARSEIMSSLAGKHMLEGFDFCGGEHCLAYLGAGGREKTTDRAVMDTQGVVLVSSGRVLSAVFSANCGGWTEDNECVWSAPPNPALRGAPDFPEGKNPARGGPQEMGMAKWLKTAPPAYCNESDENFRWVRMFSATELRDVVNKKYPIGDIRGIELGERGPGGRLKSVKIIGGKKTEVVRKELNIRLAFGGLKSGMFVVERQGSKDNPNSFTFFGGGRGHGVGLCQDGARGRAQAGAGYQEILRHYFTKADVARVR